MKIKLTKVQSEILDHRLAVSDAIADAITDGDNEAGISCEDVFDICRALAGGLTEKGLDLTKVEGMDWEKVKVVLADVVNGSTWVCTMISEVSDQKIRAHIRAGEDLAEKIAELTGLEVVFPTC